VPATDLTVVNTSAWVTNLLAETTVLPTYPTGLAEGDIVYAPVHVRPDTAGITTPTDWTSVANVVAGSTAAQGAGTGPTRLAVFRRTVPSGGLTGTETFNLTNSPNVASACMIGLRATGTGLAYSDTWGFWTVPTTGTTGQTDVSGTLGGGTASGDLAVADKDLVLFVIGATDNNTAPAVTAVAATGATFGTITTDPAAYANTVVGNDMATSMSRSPRERRTPRRRSPPR
jgi:hypothetical protein